MRILLCLTLLLSCAGCSLSHRPATRAAGDVMAAALGGAAGYFVSGEKPGGALAGAAAGFTAKKAADAIATRRELAAVREAADAAHAQAARDLYDAIQRQQAEPACPRETAVDADAATYLPVSVPERIVNGVRLDPSIEYIRVSD